MGKNDNHSFSLKARMRSFANAFSGLGLILKTEHNFRIHLSVLLLVVISGFLLEISAAEWDYDLNCGRNGSFSRMYQYCC